MSSVLPTVYQSVAVGGLLVTLGAILWMAVRLRRPRPMRLVGPLLSLALVPVSLAVYVYLAGASLTPLISAPLAIIGFLLGLRWGGSTRLSVVGGQIIGQRTVAYIVLWGLAFAGTQALAALVSAKLVTAGLATMFFAAGATVGANGYLTIRLIGAKWRLRGGTPTESIAPAGQSLCSSCRQPAKLGDKFCYHCGAPLPLVQR